MIELFGLFLNNLLPIFLAAGAGYLLARWLPIEIRTLSNIVFYIFSPCLVFTILINSQLSNRDLVGMMLFALLCFTLVGLLAWLIGRSLKFDRKMLAAVMNTSMFMNAGNYGLPVILFAFGEEALAYASLFFVANSMMINTAGVVISSMGSTTFSTSIKNLLKIPTLYGVILAVLVINFGWKLPLPLERTTQLLGAAAIPTMMVMLGAQFHSMHLGGKILPLSVASGMRLIISPLIALGLSAVFGLSGAFRQAAVLQSAMPSAVLASVLATQYDTEPSFVSAVVAITTLLSMITLPPLLAYLGS